MIIPSIQITKRHVREILDQINHDVQQNGKRRYVQTKDHEIR